MNEIITTKDVHLYYGKKEALKGITLDFPQGGIHALIGPSGCGKSTYLRCLNRMNDMIETSRSLATSGLTEMTSIRRKPTRLRSESAWAWCFSSRIRFRFQFMKTLSTG